MKSQVTNKLLTDIHHFNILTNMSKDVLVSTERNMSIADAQKKLGLLFAMGKRRPEVRVHISVGEDINIPTS